MNILWVHLKGPKVVKYRVFRVCIMLFDLFVSCGSFLGNRIGNRNYGFG